MTPDAIRWLLRSGRWQRVHHGVYANHVGRLDWPAGVSAALLYCGDGAVASYGTAARLHGLLDQDPHGIEVLIPANRRVTRPSQIGPGAQITRGGQIARGTQITVVTCADVARRTAPSRWPSRTTVEDTVLDGRVRHEGEGVFRDRTRDNDTTISGKVTLRFGWADVDAQACEVAQDVGLLLSSRGWRGGLKRCGPGCRLRTGSR